MNGCACHRKVPTVAFGGILLIAELTLRSRQAAASRDATQRFEVAAARIMAQIHVLYPTIPPEGAPEIVDRLLSHWS